MRCSKCGTEFEGNFCPSCGTPAAESASSPPVSPENPVQAGVAAGNANLGGAPGPASGSSASNAVTPVSGSPVSGGSAPGGSASDAVGGVGSNAISGGGFGAAGGVSSGGTAQSGGTIQKTPASQAGGEVSLSGGTISSGGAGGKTGKRVRKKPLIISAIAAVLVVVLVAVIIFSVRGKGGDSGLFYIKDGEVYYSDLGKKSQPWRVTSDFNLLGTDSAGSIAWMFPKIGAVASFTDDGKYVVYFDNSDEDSDGYDLYVKKPGGAGSQSEKIASDVVMYSVEGSQITYIREDSGSGALYQYNISKGSKDKVTNDDVPFYMVADGGRKLLFFVDDDDDDAIYIKYAGKDKEKVVSGVESIDYVSKDLSTVYYRKNDSLYRKREGKESEKIASDVDGVIDIYDSGECYYYKKVTDERPLSDYFDDDMRESDAAMTEPDIDDFESEDGWDFERYFEAGRQYYDKTDRDDFREYIADETYETQSYNLYYYDGSKSELISKDYYSSRKSASDAAVLVFRESKTSEPEKIKFSEMEDYYTSMYSIESEIEERTRSSTELRIAVGKNVSPMNSDTRISKISINKDGSLLYYCDADGVLSRVKIKNGKPGSPEKYDDDVSYMRFVGKSKIAYLKAYNDNEGDLYIDKKKVDSEATYSTLAYLKYKGDADSVYYFAGLNPYGIGTLKRFKGGKSEKIADDAFYNIKLLGNDKILYLYDYSSKSHTGELRLWEKGKQRKIDDDVICMISNTPMWSADYSRWY